MVNTIFILDEHLKVNKVLTTTGQNTFFDDIYTLDLSTCTESYEFSTNVTDIDEKCYVMFYYHNQYKLFQITEVEQEHSEGNIITTVYGECACLELLNNVVRVFEGEYNCISFFEHILEGTGWSIGKYSSSLAEKVVSVKLDKTTQIWSCIQDYMSEFGYELNTRVVYENGYVKSKVIDIYAEGELGEKTYKRFEYGRNVSGITKKKDLYEFCTAIIVDTSLDINNITINKDGFTKAQGSDVILAEESNSKYNNGRAYIYGNYEAKEPSGQEAVEKALEELKRRCVPNFDYECDTALTYEEFENVNIGDTVHVIDFTFNPILTLEARVGKLEISFTNRDNCKCNLTNYKEIKSKINVELTGNIREIIDSYFPITSSGIADGAITEGKIETTYLQQITSDIVSASKVVTEELIAKKIIAIDGKFENLETIYAKIENLNVTNGNITNLTSEVANIRTLINGNLTSDNIQSLVLTSDKVTIANALIKDAHIESVNASKVNTGILNTNNVSIQSEDGSMLLQGNLQQFKDKDGNVRIQIGKDKTGNFTFSLFDATGTGVLIDEKGIKSGAVADGLIVNAMVSDNANINAGKLDISSLFTEINDSTETIKSSKIYLNDKEQTLDVAFNSLSTTVENLKVASGDVGNLVEKITANTTSIQVQQGQIDTLIANTTITKSNGEVVQLKDEFNSTKDTVDSHTQTINSLQTTINGTLTDTVSQYYVSTSSTSQTGGSWSETSPSWSEGKYIWQRMKYVYSNGTTKYSTPVCIQGAKGEKGEDGTGINIIDKLTSTSQLPTTGNKGDAYTVNGVLYVWSEDVNNWIDCGNIKGEKGEDGADGTSSYLHIKYSDDGKTFTANNGETVGAYIGIYTDSTVEDSNNFNDYTWSRIRGDQGLQGLQGERGEQGIQGEAGKDGVDGRTTYFHIKYSANANGNPMTEVPSEYIGTYVDYTEADSTDYTKYTWARFQGLQGEQGEQGIPGTNGDDGQTYYLHIKYSNDGGKTFTSNNGETTGDYIGVYTDTTQADSTSVSKYTWSKVKGDTGEKGQSLTKSTPQWYLSTSNTTQTGGSWSETMPSVTSGKYMWLRYKLDWANPTSTTYTTPTLEQVAESVKEVSSKQAILEQNLDGFKTTVSNTYATISSLTNVSNNLNNNYSTTTQMNSAIEQKANSILSTVSSTYATQSTTNSMSSLIQQNADNISTKVDVNGVISSINQSAESISINASKLNLNGYVSNDEESWSISTDGNLEAKNLSIEGELSSDVINCNKINNPNYPESLSADIQLYVNASTGSDDIELEDEAVFKTLNGALDALPRNLNNWTAKIMLQTNITENITVRNINTGRLYIQLNNKTVYGWIDIVQNMGLQVFLLGGTEGTANTKDYGYIKPTEGKVRTGGVFPITALDTFSFTLYNIAVYAPTVNQTYTTTNSSGTTTTSTYTKGALHCSNFVRAYINNIKIYHTLSGNTFNTGFDNMIRTYSNAYVYIATSYGLTKNYTYYAQSGSTICLNNATQAGRYNSTSRVNTNSAGDVRWSTEPTWDGSGTSGSSDAGTAVTTKTYTKTYKSTYGDTYRSTVYNNWKKDGTCRQGDWGYGDCSGAWFFGTQFAELKGKNITKVQITITRQSGGSSSAVGLVVRTHNYSARPSGAPTLSSSSYGTLKLATGQTDKLTITNSDVLNGIKNGTIKGFGIRTTYDSAHYAVCSGSVTVKITYTE